MYRRIVKGLSVGDLYPVDQDIYEVINTEDDCYSSIFLYNEEQKEKFYSIVDKLNRKTGKEYKGKNGSEGISDVVTNRLVWDFDDADQPENSQRDCITVYERLIQHFPREGIEITFSGSKGFGIELNTTQFFNPNEVKDITSYFAQDCATYDDSIYKYSQPLRIVGTKHPKTGLYKTPIEFDELTNMSIAEIRGIATESYESTLEGNLDVPKPVLKAVQQFRAVESVKKEHVSVPVVEGELDLTQKPKWLSNWRYALLNGYFPQGTRNHAMMILAATLKKEGMTKEVAHRILKGADELHCARHGSKKRDKNEIWLEVIQTVYKPGWGGGIYAEDNFPEAIVEYFNANGIPRFSEEVESNDGVMNVDQALDVFEDFARNIDANTIKTGIKPLDKILRMTTSMMVGWLGAPGCGKTSVMLEMMSNQKESNLFFSFDMGAPLVMMRSANKWSGLSNDEVFDVFKKNDKEKIQEIRQKIKENLPCTNFCFKVGSDVQAIDKYIDLHETMTGEKTKSIVVDYLEKVKGPFADQAANCAKAAAELQELATKRGICVIVLLQPQKMAGDPSSPLRTYRRIKGASVIEQDCRVVVTMFREGYSSETSEDDNFITFCVAKNNLGPLGEADCYWDGATGEVGELDDAGRAQLAALRERLAEERDEDDL